MQTSPPQKRRFTGLLNQWLIYDKYMAYEFAKERLEEADQKVDQSVSKQIRKRLSQPDPEDPKEGLPKYISSNKMIHPFEK